MMDVQKAFDTVDRNILLAKLQNLGIRGSMFQWFQSYLCNRQFQVEIKGTFGQMKGLPTCGVLQGSSLSAALFDIYIDDLLVHMEDLAQGYCDDVLLSIAAPNTNSLKTIVENKTNMLAEWYRANRLSLHAGKTELIIFSNNKNNNPFNDFSFEFTSYLNQSNCVVKHAANEPRYLGFLFDNKFKFRDFFNKALTKIASGIAVLNRYKNCMPREIKLLIYHAFINSHLEFISLYFCMATNQMKKKISILQKKSIRIIAGVSRHAHTAKLFTLFEILPIHILSQVNIFRFMLQTQQNNLKSVFESYWFLNSQSRERTSLRKANEFKVCFSKKKCTENLPLFKFPEMYNFLLPLFDSTDRDFTLFKQKLLESYEENNECTKNNCFVCKKTKDEISMKILEKEMKLERLNRLIKRKGFQKRKRYEKLLNRIA